VFYASFSGSLQAQLFFHHRRSLFPRSEQGLDLPVEAKIHNQSFSLSEDLRGMSNSSTRQQRPAGSIAERVQEPTPRRSRFLLGLVFLPFEEPLHLTLRAPTRGLYYCLLARVGDR
jgi:hypothetical protein